MPCEAAVQMEKDFVEDLLGRLHSDGVVLGAVAQPGWGWGAFVGVGGKVMVATNRWHQRDCATEFHGSIYK